MKLFLSSVLIFLCSYHPLLAQEKAIIAKFDLIFQVSDETEFWGDHTNEYQIDLGNGSIRTIRTVDTLYAYAEKVINQKLNIKLEPQQVSNDVKEKNYKITGFPNKKVKEIAETGKYDKIIQVMINTLPGSASSFGTGPYSKRKQKVDMIVEINVFDKTSHEIESYKKRTKMDEIKTSVSIFGVRNEISLSGNELFVLFADSLENAFMNKK